VELVGFFVEFIGQVLGYGCQGWITVNIGNRLAAIGATPKSVGLDLANELVPSFVNGFGAKNVDVLESVPIMG